MQSYSFRSYEQGDEHSINDLFNYITGANRPVSQYGWQWFQAPGGRGEIWLIECGSDSGAGKTLIGHHGIMPVRFSNGSESLLFGKTENTFVHPAYRTKILYPRFEQRFRKLYEPRFHCLFSTTGPGDALRQRQAHGYTAKALWVKFVWGTRPLSNAAFMVAYLSRKMKAYKPGTLFSRLAKTGPAQSRHAGVTVCRHSSDEAREANIFHQFWPMVKNRYCITPSRDYEDLNWRFWTNPNSKYLTLSLDSETLGSGIAVISNPEWGVMDIEDFVVEDPRSKSFGMLLKSVLQWAAESGAFIVRFTTTDESVQWIGKENFMCRQDLGIWRLIMRSGYFQEIKMPRKLCDKGHKMGLTDHGWYITPIIF